MPINKKIPKDSIRRFLAPRAWLIVSVTILAIGALQLNPAHAKGISKEQMRDLLALPGDVTAEDVIAVLGDPTSRSTFDNVLTDWETAPGAPFFPWSKPNAKMEMLNYFERKRVPQKVIFVYFGGGSLDYFGVGQTPLDVTLFENVWSFNQTIGVDQIRKVFGAPHARVGPVWTYYFDTPKSMRELGVEQIGLQWIESSETDLVYNGVADVAIEGVKVRKKSNKALSQDELNREYIGFIESELAEKGLVSDARVERAEAILRKLEAASLFQVGPIPFSLLRDDGAVNAFQIWQPKQKRLSIGMTTGLFAKLSSEDELAFVLAHELMHLIRRHALYPAGFVINGRTFLEGFAAAQGREHAADVGALDLMARSGYDVSAADRVLAIMQEGSPPTPKELVTTHPPFESRRLFLADYLVRASAVIKQD